MAKVSFRVDNLIRLLMLLLTYSILFHEIIILNTPGNVTSRSCANKIPLCEGHWKQPLDVPLQPVPLAMESHIRSHFLYKAFPSSSCRAVKLFGTQRAQLAVRSEEDI